MKNKLLTQNNRKIIISFALIIAILIFNGLIGIVSIHNLTNKTNSYLETIKKTDVIHNSFEKQTILWNRIIKNYFKNKNYNNYYYHFSKMSTSIQDNIFNLKQILSDTKEIQETLNSLKNNHSKLTNNHIYLISTLNSSNKKDIKKIVANLRLKNSKIINDINGLITKLFNTFNNGREKSSKFYIELQLVTLIVLIFLSLWVILNLMKSNRKLQSKILTIAKNLNSYLPPEIGQSIIESTDTFLKSPERKFLTVCFTDLQGFTAMMENIEPERTAQFLDHFHSEMAIIAQKHGGMIDKFMGDGMMILFGVINNNNPSELAIKSINMAKDMQIKMLEINQSLKNDGFLSPLALRIGINSGYVTIGAIGPPNRRSFTAIGTPVNIASRLEKMCSPGNILISQDTWKLTSSIEGIISVNYKEIKGIKRNIKLYEINCYKDNEKKSSHQNSNI